MIVSVSGKILKKSPSEVIVDVNGLGYQCFISTNTYDLLGKPGDKLRLLTFFHVTENSQSLFGFSNETEKNLFEMLISVSGIGPKTAIALLSAVTPEEFKKRLKQTGLDPEQISFTIIATSNYLKILNQKIMTIQEVKDSNGSISLAKRGLKERWEVFQTPRHGCRITFAAILNKTIKKPEPLTPHRKGTWLARADFQLKSEIDETFKLLVEPLTEEERKRLNLHKSISQYIEIKEGTIDPEIENTHAPIMYLDEDLYDLALNFAKTDRSKVFQRKLVLDYITSITYNASKELTESNKTYEEINGSLVASIISGIDKNMSSEEKEMFLGLIQKEPEKFIATVEENILSGLQKEWKDLLLGEEQ